MKFGTIEDPENQDLGLPDSNVVFDKETGLSFQAYVGAGKWDKKYLHNFFPKGTKDELAYYATQFNAVELNATFYRLFPATSFEKWRDSVPAGFKFFPKFGQGISHWKRLQNVEESVKYHIERFSILGDRLGVPYLQMHNNFSPKNFDRVVKFVEDWKYDTPLAIECRHTDWFNDPAASAQLYKLFEENGVCNILTDTAGRRDLMHMRLTTPTAFIRWVGCNNAVDNKRLDDWVQRIADWKAQGLRELYFFVHENQEQKIVQLAEHFILGLNQKTGVNLTVPKLTARI